MPLNDLVQKGTVGSSRDPGVQAVPLTGSFPASILRQVAMSTGMTPATGRNLRPGAVEVYAEPIHHETVKRLRRLQGK